jgi:hypothetical protein
MGRRRNAQLPLGITTSKRKPGKYIAQYYDTTSKCMKFIGVYDTVEEAVKGRTEFVEMVRKHNFVVQPIKRELPKGVIARKLKDKTKYVSQVVVLYGKDKLKNATIYLGMYNTPEEAYNVRKTYLLNLIG